MHFCVILTSSNHFPKYDETVGLCNGDAVCLLWNWIFKYCLEKNYTVNRTAGAMYDNSSCLVTAFFNKESFFS